MAEQFKKILENAMRGRVFPMALAAVAGYGTATIYMNRQKSSQMVVADESQSEVSESKIRIPNMEQTEVPDSKIRIPTEQTEIPDSKIRIPMEETFLDMKDATVSAAKKIFQGQNPEDSKKDWLFLFQFSSPYKFE